MDMSDKIRLNVDNGLYTGMAILDLQMTFDTVDHDIWLCKLKSIGIVDNCINLFQSSLLTENSMFKLMELPLDLLMFKSHLWCTPKVNPWPSFVFSLC